MDKSLFENCVKFHGHKCPGLAIGYRACEIAMDLLDLSFSKDEEVVCVSENDACGIDAIQYITGCTMGKGNLILRDRGKMAFSFYVRENNNKIRLVLKPNTREMTREERIDFILNAPLEEVFEIKEPFLEIPQKAKIYKTIICEECGEGTSESKIKLKDGKKVCLDCYAR